MRKFTLYQASRFTKISRYKLEQAIEDGLLTCAEGKGNVKCYIQEEDLNDFLEKYGEQYRPLLILKIISLRLFLMRLISLFQKIFMIS